MKIHAVLPVLLVLGGCLETTVQTDSRELVGVVEGTNAFAALRFLPDNRVEGYLCDGIGGTNPDIQTWLTGEKIGNEVVLTAEDPTEQISLSGILLGETFEGSAIIDGVEHAASLAGATRPDGLYDVVFENGQRRGWIFIEDEVRGPTHILYKSQPLQFANGSFTTVASNVLKMKSRFTASMLNGYTVSPLGPGRFTIEITHDFDKFQATSNGFQAMSNQLSGGDWLIFDKSRIRSTSTNITYNVVFAPELSSPGRAIFVVDPALASSSISLLDTFTLEANSVSGNPTLFSGTMRVLAVQFQ